MLLVSGGPHGVPRRQSVQDWTLVLEPTDKTPRTYAMRSRRGWLRGPRDMRAMNREADSWLIAWALELAMTLLGILLNEPEDCCHQC